SRCGSTRTSAVRVFADGTLVSVPCRCTNRIAFSQVSVLSKKPCRFCAWKRAKALTPDRDGGPRKRSTHEETRDTFHGQHETSSGNPSSSAPAPTFPIVTEGPLATIGNAQAPTRR